MPRASGRHRVVHRFIQLGIVAVALFGLAREVVSWRPLHVREPDGIDGIWLTPDDTALMATGYFGFRRHDASTLVSEPAFTWPKGTYLLDLSPDGRRALVGTGKDEVEQYAVWDLTNHRAETSFTIPLENRRLKAVHWGTVSPTLLIEGGNKTHSASGVYLWRPGSKVPQLVPSWGKEEILVAAFSTDGSLFALATDKPRVSVYNSTSGKVQYAYMSEKPSYSDNRFGNLTFNNDNTIVAAASNDNVWLCELRNPGQLRKLPCPYSDIRTVAFSADGDVLVSGDGLGAIVCWDLRTSAIKRILRPGGAVQGLALSRDSTYLYAGVEGQHIYRWRMKSPYYSAF